MLFKLIDLDKPDKVFWTKLSLILRKPLYDCLFCMSGIWGLLFSIRYFSFTWEYMQLIFVVAGINYFFEILINKAEEESEEINCKNNL